MPVNLRRRSNVERVCLQLDVSEFGLDALDWYVIVHLSSARGRRDSASVSTSCCKTITQSWALLHRGREVFLSRYFRKARSYFRLTVHTCTFRSHLEASVRCRLRECSRGGISTGIGVQNEAVGT
ncbi:hypothetical protein HBI60_162960 [Parastagonospora nodorum]|nr:hypothetical protein HBI83_151200 [Parastagonospora nodorum]KAH6053198.1 hypothetical protein HBI54_022560 [Parastagonospora nodorum]KAH6391835.1 hypothetical protein HBI60_162960 [Parastagonospora nodorum]